MDLQKYKGNVDSEEIERMFNDDIRQKALIGRSAHSRATKNSCSSIYSEVDLYKGKEAKQEYMDSLVEITGRGGVKVSNLRDEITNIKRFDEIMVMPFKEGHDYLTDIKNRHSIKTLLSYWNVSTYKVYQVLYAKYKVEVNGLFGASKSASAPVKAKAAVIKPEIIKTEKLKTEVMELMKPETKAVKEHTPIVRISQGFDISLQGKFSGQELADRILALGSLMDKDTKFNVALNLIEVMAE